MRGSAGAIVNHVTSQYQDQGRLLEEATRDLDVFKKAYYKAEREIQDYKATVEQEKRLLSDEIHHLKVRHSPSISNAKPPGGRFKQFRRNLISSMTTRGDANSSVSRSGNRGS